MALGCEGHDTKPTCSCLKHPGHEIERTVRSCSRFKEAKDMAARDNMTQEVLFPGDIIGTIVEIYKRSVIT